MPRTSGSPAGYPVSSVRPDFRWIPIINSVFSAVVLLAVLVLLRCHLDSPKKSIAEVKLDSYGY